MRWRFFTKGGARGRILFEYAPEPIEQGLELSPLHVPLPLATSAKPLKLLSAACSTCSCTIAMTTAKTLRFV